MITQTTKRTRTISEFFVSSDRLSQICNHIEKINELQIILLENLDSPLNEHVIVADIRQQTLVLHTDSAAWAAKLRYLTPELLKAFKSDTPRIRTIRIKVMPPDSLNQTTRRAQPVSAQAADAMREVADKIEDPALRSTLLSLAGNLGSE